MLLLRPLRLHDVPVPLCARRAWVRTLATRSPLPTPPAKRPLVRLCAGTCSSRLLLTRPILSYPARHSREADMIGPQWLRSSRPLLPTARGSTVPRPVATFLALPSSAMPALSDAATHPGRTSHAGAWDIKLIKLFLERVYELLVGATPPLKSPLITPPSLRRRRSLPPPLPPSSTLRASPEPGGLCVRPVDDL